MASNKKVNNFDTKKLQGQVVFITGGTSGFGYHLVQELLLNGSKVVVADTNCLRGHQMQEVVDSSYFMFIECDVTFKFQVKDAIEQTYHKFGRIDGIVNCAGVFDIEPIIIRESLTAFYTIPQGFFTNLLGSLYSLYYYSQYKDKEEGVIINVGPMINSQELNKLSKYFQIWTSINSFTPLAAEYFRSNSLRFLSISPSSMEIQMPSVDNSIDNSTTREMIMDTVLKRYKNHNEFVSLVIYALTNSGINGVELELGNTDFNTPPTIAKM